jgi:hypothetical protein
MELEEQNSYSEGTQRIVTSFKNPHNFQEDILCGKYFKGNLKGVCWLKICNVNKVR